MQTKSGEKEFLKSYIVLLSCHLTCTGRPAHSAGLIGAVQLSPQKDNVQFQKFFLPQFCVYSQSKIYFFLRHVLPIPFLGQNSHCYQVNQKPIVFYIPRIDGCIEPKTIVKILLFSRVHALTIACTLEDSKKFFYSQGYTLENRKISFSVFPVVMTYRGVQPCGWLQFTNNNVYAVSLARAHRVMRTSSLEIGVQCRPPAFGRRSTLDPNFSGLRSALPGAPSPDSPHSLIVIS